MAGLSRTYMSIDNRKDPDEFKNMMLAVQGARVAHVHVDDHGMDVLLENGITLLSGDEPGRISLLWCLDKMVIPWPITH